MIRDQDKSKHQDHDDQEDGHLDLGLPERLVTAGRVVVRESCLHSFFVIIRLFGLDRETSRFREFSDNERGELEELDDTLAPFLAFFSDETGVVSGSAFLLRPLET